MFFFLIQTKTLFVHLVTFNLASAYLFNLEQSENFSSGRRLIYKISSDFQESQTNHKPIHQAIVTSFQLLLWFSVLIEVSLEFGIHATFDNRHSNEFQSSVHSHRTQSYRIVSSNWLVVLGFNITLTAKVISWRSVTHMCFSGFLTPVLT